MKIKQKNINFKQLFLNKKLILVLIIMTLSILQVNAFSFIPEKVQTVIVSSGELIQWYPSQTYDADFKVSPQELTSLNTCNTGVCSQESLSAGAAYYKDFATSKGVIRVFYDQYGNIVGTQVYDSDSDGVADVSDTDRDGDGIPNSSDTDPDSAPTNWHRSDVVGTIPGNFSVSPSGASSYDIPIQVANGIAGLQPGLSLSYNSHGGNGIVGVGWSLSGLSSIKRCASTIATDGQHRGVNLDKQDQYCLDGQRLIRTSGTQGGDAEYRTEIDSFSRIKSYGNVGQGPAYFKVWSNDGRIMTYGQSGASRHTVNNSINRWMVQTVDSASGSSNRLTYNYSTQGNRPRLDNISYGGGSVKIHYQTRQDTRFSYFHGQKITKDVRVSKISVHDITQSQAIHEYSLQYGSTRESRLTGVTLCAQGLCLPKTVFEWNTNTDYPTDVFSSRSKSFIPLSHGITGSFYNRARPLATDFDGNGINEIVPKSLDNYISSQQGKVYKDFDGDGLTDVYVYGVNTRDYPFVTKDIIEYGTLSGPRFSSHGGSTYKVGRDSDLNSGDARTLIRHFGDVNNDGLIDVISRGTGLDSGTISINNGRGKEFTTINWSDKGWPHLILDLNGDGDQELVLKKKQIPNEHNIIFGGPYIYPRYDVDNLNLNLNLLSGYELAMSSGTSDASPLAPVADFNGDGLLDVFGGLTNQGSGIYQGKISYAKGDGQFDGELYVAGAYTPFWPTREIPKYVDLNGDGLTDILVKRYVARDAYILDSYISLGNSSFKLIVNEREAVGRDFHEDSRYSVAQFDGENGPDFYVTEGNHEGYLGRVFRNQIVKPRIVRVRHNTGNGYVNVDTKISYKPLTDTSNVAHLNELFYSKGSHITPVSGGFATQEFTNHPTFNIQNSTYVVSKVETNTGKYVTWGYRTMLYAYGGFRGNHHGRGNLGFEWIHRIDADKQKMTTTHYRQDFPYIGKADTIEVLRLNTAQSVQPLAVGVYAPTTQPSEPTSGLGYSLAASSINNSFNAQVWGGSWKHTQLSWSQNTYSHAQKDVSGGRYFHVRTMKELTHTHDPLTGARKTKTVIERPKATWDSYNFPTVIKTTKSKFDGSDAHTSTTTLSYNHINNGSYYRLGLPSRETVVSKSPTDTNGKTVAKTFAYDSRGRLTAERIQPEQNGPKTNYTYDTRGNVTQVSVTGYEGGTQTRTSKTEYDARGRYPTRQINALNQATVFKYNEQCGQAFSVRPPTGLTTYSEYDLLCRFVREIRPNRTESRTQYLSKSRLQIPSSASSFAGNIEYGMVERVDGTGDKVTYYDRLGRALLVKVDGFNGDILVETHYDEFGRVSKTSMPYYDYEAPIYLSTAYDWADRPTHQYRPDGKGGRIYDYIRYNGYRTTTRDAELRERTVTLNVVDQVVQVEDELNAGLTHQYDGLGALTSTNSNGIVTSAEYDALGRRIALNDPSVGRWTYTYNGFNELKTQRNAKNQVVTNSYNALGQLTRRVEPEGTTTWQYYTSGKGLNQLQTVQGPDGYREDYTYDYYSRLHTKKTVIAGKTYQTDINYDMYGRVASTTNPESTLQANSSQRGRLTIERDYDDNGFLIAVSSPREQITDYDWQHLFDLMDELVADLESLESIQAQNSTLATYYTQKAVEYQGIAQSSAASSLRSELNTLIAQLTTQAEVATKAAKKASSDFAAKMETARQAWDRLERAQYAQTYQNLLDDPANAHYWQVVGRDSANRLTSAVQGNGLGTEWDYNLANGELDNISSRFATQSGGKIRDLSYDYDKVNSLKYRKDNILGVQESFSFDDLDRLTTSAVQRSSDGYNHTTDYRYDVHGNLTYKTGQGDYTYGPSGDQPFALRKVVADSTVNTQSTGSASGSTTTTTTTSVPSTPIIVDNQDANTSQVGNWTSSGGPNPYNGNSVYSSGANTFSWTADLPASGEYEVQVWWTNAWSSRVTQADYQITTANGTVTQSLNQRDPAGQWVSLGTHSFAAGDATITVGSQVGGNISADAVQFIPQSSTTTTTAPAPTTTTSTQASGSPVIIDNVDSNTSQVGSWNPSSGANPYGDNSVYSTGSNTFSWNATLQSGQYEVQARWTEAWNSRVSAADYTVAHANGTDTKTNKVVNGLA